jgi:hypothetical protein
LNLNKIYAENLLAHGLAVVLNEKRKDGFVIVTIKWYDIDGDVNISNFRRNNEEKNRCKPIPDGHRGSFGLGNATSFDCWNS